MNKKIKNTSRRSSTFHQMTDILNNKLKLPSINKEKQNKTNINTFAQDQNG